MLFCILITVGFSIPLIAKTQEKKLVVPARVVWMVKSTIDSDDFGVDTSQSWRNRLNKLNFKFLPSEENESLVKKCSVEDGAYNELCSLVNPQNSDIFITGTMKLHKQYTGPVGPKLGIKVAIHLKGYRTDEGIKMFEINQQPYGTGENTTEAFFSALDKVKIPVAIQMSNLVAVHLNREYEGVIKIHGFKNAAEKEDPLTSLRFVKGVTSLIMEESTRENATFRIGFTDATWGGIVHLINTTQGSGIKAKITDNLKAEANYDKARAFRLLTAVTEVEAAAQVGLSDEKLETIAVEIENAIEYVDYMRSVQFPVRLSHTPSKARKEMRLHYGGDIVFIPIVIKENDQNTLLVEVWSTFAGKLFSVDSPIYGNKFTEAARKAIFKVKEQMLPMLKRRRGKMPKLQRSQYDAWIQLMNQ